MTGNGIRIRCFMEREYQIQDTPRKSPLPWLGPVLVIIGVLLYWIHNLIPYPGVKIDTVTFNTGIFITRILLNPFFIILILPCLILSVIHLARRKKTFILALFILILVCVIFITSACRVIIPVVFFRTKIVTSLPREVLRWLGLMLAVAGGVIGILTVKHRKSTSRDTRPV